MNNRKIGNENEERACKYLEGLGIKILDRNFYTRQGETDIVALDNDILCFIEVKYRKNVRSGYAEEAVTFSKMVKICRNARYYIYSHSKYTDSQIRFDVLAMDDESIRYYKDAFDYVGDY